jgi:hypothetical protein
MNDSSNAVGSCYEIWLSAPCGYREPVRECGKFRSQRDAERMASQLRDWLHLGVRPATLLACVKQKRDRKSLLMMHEYLGDLGVDPATVTVFAVPQGVEHDNAVEPPAVRIDRGHEVRGPRRRQGGREESGELRITRRF